MWLITALCLHSRYAASAWIPKNSQELKTLCVKLHIRHKRTEGRRDASRRPCLCLSVHPFVRLSLSQLCLSGRSSSYLLSCASPAVRANSYLWHAPRGTAILPAFRGDRPLDPDRGPEWRLLEVPVWNPKREFRAPSLPTNWFTLFSGCGFGKGRAATILWRNEPQLFIKFKGV